ncbi:carboxymuconolactone decarboxylase family protein [Alkalilimnicola ehrlichii]|uniref:carboxymuconolactone decarboxylase family protein n=1 Tax=Alkalilimnicola ehrlichii TaxID=351052 RepID=UPI001C6E94D1|nr:carboxymuconolactone decarboxylase family protein [Alkalilimnicola ehrlichii]
MNESHTKRGARYDQLSTFGAGYLAETYPEIWEAYEQLGEACANVGPLDPHARRLIKLALAVASRSEGATHSHARRALAEGLDPEELRQVALMAIPTIGLPQSVAALTWIEDIIEEQEDGGADA